VYHHAPKPTIMTAARAKTHDVVFMGQIISYSFLLFVAEEAAQAHGLMRAGFYIAVTARAKEHGGFAGLNYPVAVLLVLLRRPLELGDMDGGLLYVRIVCHSFL